MGAMGDVSTDPGVCAAIERLYAVFARYSLRQHIEGCPHCFGASDDDTLHSAPLREMPEGDLTMFAWKTMTTWGDERDFKHFFPRLCEFSVASDDLLHYGMWLFKRKMPLTDFAAWPREERKAFAAFLLAWWRALLAAADDADHLDYRLLISPTADDAISPEAIAPYVGDLRPFLDALLEAPSGGARLLALATYRRLYWQGDTPIASFTPAQREQVAAWLLDVRTLDVLRRRATEVAQASGGGEREEALFSYEEWPSAPSRLAADVLDMLG
jgi:hypothetical protein